MPEFPTISEFLEIAPVATIVLVIVGLGFYVGWKSRGEAMSILKDWLDELRRR